MKKLQQFYILKFLSSRLKRENYQINITLDQARINNEVVTINNSELLRTLFRLKKIDFDQGELEKLLISSKKIKKLENNERNRKKLEEISLKIENMLFVEDFVSIQFDNKAHYQDILNRKGFYVNGIRFVPFLASAGMIRKNTALFINNNLKHPIMDILENGRNESVELVPAKFGAYFSLYSSSTLPVSFPKFAVIPDREIETIRRVDFVTYQGEGLDDKVEEIDYPMSLNAWDGQGLIKPSLAKQWSDELELDYTFSCAVIRAPFLKGLIVTFDLLQFANEISRKYTFTDIYGETQDIREIDLIITESMFKLWSSYENTAHYVENCYANKLGFSIAKVTPKDEKSYSRTSYQFLQVLNLNDVDIAKLCEPTIDWFRNISGGNQNDMVLYATGEGNLKPEDFNRMDVATRAILLNPELTRDKYIQEKFVRSIEKKKRQSFMGSIYLNSNYQFMISDPFYQASAVFGMNIPLLAEGEHYNQYWLDRGIDTVAAVRSPIVHHSEFNVLNLIDNEYTRKWYKHIHSGVIFPANGIGMDCAIHGGADFDGDLICTINNRIMIKGQVKGLPIMYESKKSPKKPVDSRNDKEQVEGQLKGYNSKVGFATNVSSSLYSMMYDFPEGSEERDVILDRLKIGRVIQGEIIDGVKGLDIPPFREHWVKWSHIDKEDKEELRERKRHNNKLVCEIRPAFFRFLYPHYMTRYNKELKRYDITSRLRFGVSFGDIARMTSRTKEQQELYDRYKNRTFFLDNGSVVNKMSAYMRTALGLINKYSLNESKKLDYKILLNPEYETNVYGIKLMKEYLEEYKTFKKGMRNDLTDSFESLDAFISYLKKKCFSNISSNHSELANYAVEVTYNGETSMVEFAWRMFPEGMIENIMRNASGKIHLPVKDKNGEIEYMWERYSMVEYDLEDLYEN